MIQLIAGAGAAGLLVGSLTASYLMAEYKDATWSAATNEIKVDAAKVLQAETEHAITVEREANAKVRELEAGYVVQEKNLADVQRRNRELATQLGGLRDPGRRPSRPNPMPTVAVGAQCPEEPASSGLLSAEASGVLLDASAEVDALAEYARVCYEWKDTVVQMFQTTEGTGHDQ